MPDKSKEYSKQRHRLTAINLILAPLLLALLIAAGPVTYFKELASSLSSNDYLNLFAFYLSISIVCYAAMLPFKYYAGFVLEHRFSLSNQTLDAWLKRELKRVLVSFVIVTPLVFSLYVFVRYWPLQWWLFAALLWFLVSVLVAKFAPTFIIPLFYRYSDIKSSSLKSRLIALASKAGFRAEGVYGIDMSKDTKKANAALLGTGRQKRIVLCDTLLDSFTEDEIESVMGHELGHHKMRHIIRLLLFGGVFSLLVFKAADIVFLRLHNALGYLLLYDLDSLMLLCAIMSVLNLLVLPLHNAFSRKLEQEADAFALRITGDKASFVSTMKKLADQNLADLNPGKFYEILLYSHPPISRRISFAESFKIETTG